MFFKSLQSGRKSEAFTLPEVIISMSVIVIVVMAATNMLTSIIRSNTENQNTLIAYGLAQEGLEALRNIRDSNWLLGANFSGAIDSDTTLWGSSLPATVSNTPVHYAIFPNHLSVVSGQAAADVQSLKDYTPWILVPVSGTDNPENSASTLVYKLVNNDGAFAGYGQSAPDAKPTPFHRSISIVAKAQSPAVDGQANQSVDSYRVTSSVVWMESGRRKIVQLDTELTDWKR